MSNNRQTMEGFTLIEVLVTLLVLAIGLLGLAGMQTSSLKHNNNAYQRTQATFLAYDILDRMRANPGGIDAGDYNAVTANVNTGYSLRDPGCINGDDGCTSSDLAESDIFEWATDLATALPSGRGQVAVSDDPARPFTFEVTVRWDELRTGATGTACDPENPDDMTCFSVTGRVLYDRL